jgi:hygromycin-B 4-O-kinase
MNIDTAAAQRFLVEQVDPTAGEVEPAGAGAWSRAFSFRRGSDELIVRFGSHGDDFAKDRRAYHYRMAGLPVPEVLALGSAFGGHYAISRRVWGVSQG